MATLVSCLRPLLLISLSLCLAGCSVAVPLLPEPAPAAEATPTRATPWPGVGEVLADPPAPGTSLELDAYFGGGGVPSPGEGACPTGWGAALTDRPFQASLSILNGTAANSLAAEEAWLIAVTPGGEAPQLPYHARLRGHLGDPAFAHCPNAARMFVVEAVVEVYQEAAPTAELPEGHDAWPRHREATLGYSLPFPPGSHIERLDDGTVTVTLPEWPGYPVAVRAHAGETYCDPFDPASAPPLLQGAAWTVYEQKGASGAQAGGSGRLAGYRVERDGLPRERTTSVLISGGGLTYELSLRYPLGLDAPQPLLDVYTAIVEGYRLNEAPRPSPTPAVRQVLGAGPFLSQEEALAQLRTGLGQEVELLFAELVAEGAARQGAFTCGAYAGHSDGVWVLAVRGSFDGAARVMRYYLDATNGQQLCGEEIDPGILPTPTPTPTPTPLPTPTPTPTPRPETGSEDERWIEVILSEQTLVAWQGQTEVRRMVVSTGMAQTPTVTGRYRVYLKMLSTRMTGPGYDLPNVPHVLFFYAGYAIHGAYWHMNFGTPMSHGCVNLKLDDAAWLFEWAGPRLPPGAGAVYASDSNPGTPVVVRW